MTDSTDDKLGQLLRSVAPPERDRLFRIRVLERRENQRYQRRNFMLATTAGGCILFFAALVQIQVQLFTAIAALAFGIVLLIPLLLLTPTVTRALQGSGGR